MPVRNVSIHLRSVIDGDEAHYDYQGEYRRKTGSHNIVYTDYTGNEITKVAIEAAENAMLLHRVGGITADMLFDPLAETVVKYDALSLRHGFLLRTDAYRLTERGDGVSIYTEYCLNDGSAHPPICGLQEMTISIWEDRECFIDREYRRAKLF